MLIDVISYMINTYFIQQYFNLIESFREQLVSNTFWLKSNWYLS